MKEFILNYYPEFECIAGNCKHTCCAGWNTYIDAKTLNAYKNNVTPFKNTLHSGIDFKKSKFKRNKKRCAFLNEKGLCEIILNLGKESLCQICRDHPRFKSNFSNITETGLGFCCEESARIILSFKDKILPILIGDDNKEQAPSFIEEQILNLKNSALNIIQNRERDITDRITELLTLCDVDITNLNYKKLVKLFISLERLDKSWSNDLKTLLKTPFSTEIPSELSLFAEQFIVNSLYRHLSSAEDIFYAKGVTLAIIFSWWLIQNVIKSKTQTCDFSLLVDVVRGYSAEVEYSTKNLTKLFDFACKFINF